MKKLEPYLFRFHNYWKSFEDENKGVRAELKRCNSWESVLAIPGFWELVHFLKKNDDKDGNIFEHNLQKYIVPLAMTVGVISHIKEDSNDNLIAKMRDKNPDKSSKSTHLRFRQLIQSNTPNDFYRKMIRSLSFVDNKVNIKELVNDIFDWYNEFVLLEKDYEPTKWLLVKWSKNYFSEAKDNSSQEKRDIKELETVR